MITPQEIKDANAAQAAEYRKTAAFWSAEFEATNDPEDAEKAAYYAKRAAECEYYAVTF